MSRQGQRRSPPSSPSDLRPDDFEALVQMHQRYPEDVVSRASRRALREGRRRSQLSDVSGMTPFPSISQSPSQLDMAALSTTSSPQLAFTQIHRFSAASTSSSYSGLSAAGDSGPSGSYLAPPRPGHLRRRPSETTIEAMSGRDDSSAISRDEYQEHSESEGRTRSRRSETVKNYVCTYCNKDFGGKSDWKRHETTFHEPQYIWQCPICNRSFNSKRKFSTHHGRDHNCDGCNHALEAQKALREKTAFGCGFRPCTQVLYSWDERCNHVAKHFEDGEVKENWQYSTMIRNLLRQEPLDGPWRALLTELHGSRENWPDLTWRQEDTRALRDMLEYGNFGNIPELLQEIWRSGQRDTASQPTISGMSSPAPLHVMPFEKDDSLAAQSQLHAMGVVAGTGGRGHPALGAEMYGEVHPDMQYYHTQTMTPPSEVVPATAYGLQPGPHGQVYQQLPYAGQPGFQSPYHLEHPQPYPPVPPGNILASDAYYTQRPYPEPSRSPLPPQTQSAPPGRNESPQRRQRSGSSRPLRVKQWHGAAGRGTSMSYGSPYARPEQALDHADEDDDDNNIEEDYLHNIYSPDSFF